MKKYFLMSILVLSTVFQVNAQSKGAKIGYIDMEYILQNVPDYNEAKSQLEQKAQKWKQDIETKKVEIAKLKDALKTEKALLTKELVDDREEEIKFQENELLDFQQKKFGPNGDLMTQKAVLVKPIQDQVFTAVQDIAEAKKYDFVFDKASDLTMLFSAKRYDISDQVLRVITRAEKREQKTKKEVKAQEAKDALDDAATDANPKLEERKKALEEKKKAREDLVAQRKADAIAKKEAADAHRAELLATKSAKKTGTVPANGKPAADKTTTETNKTSDTTSIQNTKEDKAAARAKLIEDRKRALEERKRKIIEDREAAKKAKEDAKAAKDKPKTE